MIVKIPNTNFKFDVREDIWTDEVVIREIWTENVYEVDEGRFTKGGTVVDIGANIGAFSVLAAHYGAGKIIAVEPEPHNLAALKTNIQLNNLQNKISVVEVAVSDYEGNAVIGDDAGGATIKDEHTIGATVPVTTLDALFSSHNIESVDVLKVDVEGSEREIILGASRETLQKCRYITMEFDVRSGYAVGDMVKKLTETHHVRTMGSWERGGMVWAWIY